MDDESNIRQAQPKQGLETGSLEGATGGFTAKQQIVRNYEDDLAGANGPDARFDALDELISLKVREAINGITFSSPKDTHIFGRNGRFSVNHVGRQGEGNVRREVREAVETELWSLNVVDFSTGTVSVNCGTIILDGSNLTAGLTISGAASTFNMSSGDKLFLKLEDLDAPTCTLTKASSWTDYPSRYEVTGTGGSAAFAAYHYPLYYFDGTNSAGAIAVASGVFAHRVAEYNNFELVYSNYQVGLDAALLTLRLISCHGKMPA